MIHRPVAGWMLAASFALMSGSAPAAPQDCLTLRDNPAVAACANQYGTGTSGVRPRATPAATRPDAMPIRVVADGELRSVPVVRALPAAAASPPEPQPQAFAVDRQMLTNTVFLGAAAASLLVLVTLGFWRWGMTLRKDCPWCGSKISKSAHTCSRCFRVV